MEVVSPWNSGNNSSVSHVRKMEKDLVVSAEFIFSEIHLPVLRRFRPSWNSLLRRHPRKKKRQGPTAGTDLVNKVHQVVNISFLGLGSNICNLFPPADLKCLLCARPGLF